MTGKVGSRQAKEVGSRANKKRHPQKCFFTTIYSQYLIRFSPPTVFSLPTAYCHPPTVISLPTAICLLPSAYSLRLLPSAY